MTFPRARLAVSAILFVGWLGFLLYLVIDSPTVILSRPQFLGAQLFVVADIAGTKPAGITIDELLWSNNPADAEKLVKKQIQILGAADWTRGVGYEGPGKYLLPLVRTGQGSFLVATLPNSVTIRIYPWTPKLREQVEEIVQSRK
jgi:hypothetical protein